MESTDPSSDLLFGLLAFQAGLIDQGQLDAGIRSWTSERSGTLAASLVSRGDLDTEERAGVERMIALQLKKRGGDPLKSLSSLPLGDGTREFLARAGIPLGGETFSQHGSGSERTAVYAGEWSPSATAADGGRFRVLRPHAQGGLGVVFVAFDQELEREVALKQIVDSQADEIQSRRRFLLEAQITGGLEHPGIVPVYGLGSYSDGRPYYAMRFIRGDSLKEAVERFHADATLKRDDGRRSLELRRLLRRFIDVCNAIGYAHSRGVLHRDLKPSNIVVGKHGETLVIDWGLAKATGRADPASDERSLVPSSGAGSAETLPGTAMGTPAYMSPEQAAGELDRLGEPSDVYSLGATLYFILTGSAAFAGSVADVLRSVRDGSFRVPRAVAPTIDKGLEAVCLKAMAKNPVDRYPTARSLADDIERWMADEPVTARREPWIRKLLRWLTRHRTAMTAAGAASLMALLGLAAISVVQLRANRDLEAASRKVRARNDLATEAIRSFHTGIAEEMLLKEEKFAKLRTDLLGKAQQFYGKLEELLQGESDLESRKALASAYFELGELTTEIGSKERALETHRRGLAIREALAREPAHGLNDQSHLGLSHQAIGRVLRDLGRIDEGLAEQTRGRAALAAVAAARPGDLAAQRHLERSLDGIGHLLGDARRWEECRAVSEEALSIQLALAKANPTDPRYLVDAAKSNFDLSLCDQVANKPNESLAHVAKAVQAAEDALRIKPDDIEARKVAATAEGQRGRLLVRTGRVDEGFAAGRSAIERLESLVSDYPTSSEFRFRLAEALFGAGWDRGKAGRNAEMVTMYRRALDLVRGLGKLNPGTWNYLYMQSWRSCDLGFAYERDGRLSEALDVYEEARDSFEQSLTVRPNDAEARSGLVRTLSRLGELQLGKSDFVAASKRFEEALSQSQAAPELQGEEDQSVRCGLLGRIGALRLSFGKLTEAEKFLRSAVAAAAPLKLESPEHFYGLATVHSLLSVVRGDAASTADSAAEADLAMRDLRRAVAAGFTDVAYLRADPLLQPIRARADFERLLLDLGFPADPFRP